MQCRFGWKSTASKVLSENIFLFVGALLPVFSSCTSDLQNDTLIAF